MIKKILLILFFLLFIGVKYAYAEPVGAVIWAIGVFIVDTIWAHPIISAMVVASIAYSLATATNQDRLKTPSSKYTSPVLDNTYSNEGIVPIIYGGPIVVGGNIIWQSDPGTTVQRFLALCIGEVSAITNVELDDIDIDTLSGCNYTAYYGTATQTVDSRAGTTVKGLRHVAYIAATITAGDKVSSNPILSARITGRKIQTWNSVNDNWTTNALTSSKNPAAIIRDYLLLSTVLGGCGVPAAYVDNASFGAVSVICDALIDNGSGGTEPRYELDIVIDTKHSALDNLDKMLITCNAALIRSGATYKLAIEKSGETAVQAFTEDNINKGTFSYGYGKADETPNKVGVEWIEALETKNPKRIAWAEDELDQETRGVREEKIETYGIIRQTQASRQAKKLLYERKINDVWCEFGSNMSAMHCEPFDVVSVTHSRPNWTAALFRIIEMNEVDFGVAKYLLQAYNSSTVDDRQGSTLDDWDYGSPPNPFEAIPDVADLAISEVGWVNADGTYIINIATSWTAPSTKKELLESYVIELQKGSDAYIVIGNASASATAYRININLEAGVAYRVRIKTKSINNIISNGTVSSQITLVGEASAPPNVSGFIYSWGKELEISWNNIVNADLAGYEIRDENANFGTDNVRLIYRGLGNRKILVPSTRAPGTYYLKAFNTSGVYSTTAASITPTNSVPGTPSVTLNNWFGFAILSWTDDTAVDIEYYEVYQSDTNLWTGEETLYARVSGKSAQVQGNAPVDAVADAANATSITDADLAGKGVNYFVGDVIKQTSGSYGNQEAVITAFNNTTGQVTVASWPSGTPSINDEFALKDRAHFKVRGVDRYGAGLFSSSILIDFIQLTEAEIGDKVISARKVTTGELITLSAQIRNAIITSAKIASLTADKITTGSLTGQVLTGGTIRTAASGARFAMTSDSLLGYDIDGNLVFQVILSGDDVGDVVMGSSSKYVKWDASAGKLFVAELQSPDYILDTSGFKLSGTDGLEINSGKLRGKVVVNSLSLAGFINYGGDGSDGNVTISGDTDISNSVKQYNRLTINAGITLTAKNCIIGVKEILTVNGTISADGGGYSGGQGQGNNNAGYPIAGTSANTDNQTFSSGGGGGGGGDHSGATTANGADGGTAGGAGGAGSTSSGTPGTDGSAATSAKQTFVKKVLKNLICFSKGGGGGGGSGGAGADGGAGGNGGGFLLIECDTFLGNTGSIISADGNAGITGHPASGGGGGGGGGGGTVFIRYKTLSANNGTIRANGGAAGTAGASSSAGGAGGAGITNLEAIT